MLLPKVVWSVKSKSSSKICAIIIVTWKWQKFGISVKTTLLLFFHLVSCFLPVWPDLAEFQLFGKILQALGNFLRVSWYSADCWTYFGQLLSYYGNFPFLQMAKYWKNYLAIWSHCFLSLEGNWHVRFPQPNAVSRLVETFIANLKWIPSRLLRIARCKWLKYLMMALYRVYYSFFKKIGPFPASFSLSSSSQYSWQEIK